MLGHHVPDLVPEHARQLGLVGHLVHDGARDKHLLARQREGVDDIRVQEGERPLPLGAVHFLTRTSNLHELHRRVGTQPFSMVVSSSFKRSPLQVTSSAYAAEPLLHAEASDEQRPSRQA